MLHALLHPINLKAVLWPVEHVMGHHLKVVKWQPERPTASTSVKRIQGWETARDWPVVELHGDMRLEISN